MNRKLLLRLLGSLAVFVLGPARAADPAPTGTIEGRVHNSATGDYLGKARVTVIGQNVSALTNEFGEYRIEAVAPGEVKLTAFYSGLPEQTTTVMVGPGARVVRDFDLKGVAASDVVKLEAFSVTASREMSGAAIATNEQRFALNMKTVVSSDTFGDQSEGNVAEFLKYLPSIGVGYVDQDARTVSVRGMPAEMTIVTSNGMEVASAAATATRAFEFEKATINDIAHIEFNKTLLPDMPAEGIGGTINMVTKSAFQRTRPQFNYRAYMNFNTKRVELKKTPGATKDPSWKILPGFDFTYIRPVTKNFGFTVSGAMSQKFNPQNLATTTWTLNPDPVTGVQNPYLRSITMQDTPKFTDRISGRVSLDWRFAPNDVISVGFSEQYYDAMWTGRRYSADTGTAPVDWSREFTQGRPAQGSVSFSSNASRKQGTTWTPEFRYNHNGPIWRGEVRSAYSHSSNHMRDMEDRHFSIGNFTLGQFTTPTTALRPTVRFDNTGNYMPVITATLGNQVVDSQDVNNHYLGNVGENYREASDVKKNVYYNLRRNFEPGFPLTVKVGGDVRQNIRDLRTFNPTYTFPGADGRVNTLDNHISTFGVDIVDRYSEIDPPYGMPKFKWPSLYKVYDYFDAHRDWFVYDEAAAHRGLVAGSIFVRETISSGFLRMDGSFLRNRLTVVGGVRFQNYRVYAESGEIDNLGRYIHDNEGNIVFDPVTGRALQISGTANEITKLTNIERAVQTTNTVPGWYPSFNAVYRITDDIQLRVGYANSVNYPNLGEIAGTTTVSDLSTSGNGLVTANTPLKPWYGKNYDIDIEYYTPGGGAISVSWFRKDISDFVNQARYESGTPEATAALNRYGYGVLAPLGYDIVEKFNGGEARFTGVEFGFNQQLDPFVPDWARGVHVFLNTSYKAAPRGVSAEEVNGRSERRINWGTTIRRGRFIGQLRWNHVPMHKTITAPTATTGRSNSRTFMDVDFSFRLRGSMSVYANAYNVLSQESSSHYYSDQTPDYARRRGFNTYGVQCTVGLKGQF